MVVSVKGPVAFIAKSLLLRRLVIMLWHVLGVVLAYFFAFFLRFDGHIPGPETGLMLSTLPVLLLISLLVFAIFRLYSGVWVFVSLDDLVRILSALVVTTNLFVLAVFLKLDMSFQGYPRSVFAIQFLLMAGWMTGGRLLMRWIRERRVLQKSERKSETDAVIVGDLDGVDHLLHAVRSQHGDIGRFTGIVTDEKTAHGLTVRGIRVFGSVERVGAVARETEANCVLILPPYTRPRQMNQVVENCEKEGVGCTFRMVPSTADLAAGRIELSSIKKVEIEDLLGRPSVKFDREQVKNELADKVVMITGAGGSIGSELARQVAHYDPRLIVLFDNSEFNLYSIDMELRQTMPHVSVVAYAGDIERRDQVSAAINQFEVQILYHAAAYKHVPLMEANVCACVRNNVQGTAVLADEAEKSGVERFVLISSDKAVRPTSVMGASKRLAERVIMERASCGTRFVAVRFGNVLGSSGSVIPLFKKQIEAGGPVTVTSRDVTRFFMSIPEAVDLVLQASVVGEDRQVMVLEMGESVKVVDMAKRLIELSGLRVGEDIEIVFTGLRPGEKEYEELMTDNEDVVNTSYEKIWVMRKQSAESDPKINMEVLSRLIGDGDEAGIRMELCRLISDADRNVITRNIRA